MRQQPIADLVPQALRQEVIDAAGGFVLNDIDRMFRSEGFKLPDGFIPVQGAMRRSTAAAYDEAIDFTSGLQVEAYLRVIERLIDELTSTSARTDHPWSADRLRRLSRELGRAGVTIQADGRLVAPRGLGIGSGLSNAPTSTGIHLAISRLERSEAEP